MPDRAPWTCRCWTRRGGLPVPVPDHHVRAHRQAPGGEDQLHVLLVHADRAGQHARTHVGHPGHLQEPLYRAVLAERAVQDRQHHIDAGQHVWHGRDRGGRGRGQRGACPGRSLPSRDRLNRDRLSRDLLGRDLLGRDLLGRPGYGGHRGQGPAADGQPLRLVPGENPPAIGQDADGHDLVAIPVECGQHGPRAHAGHRVLRALTTEYHRDPDLALLVQRVPSSSGAAAGTAEVTLSRPRQLI